MSQLFRSTTAAGVWREHWCERCHHPDEINRRDHGIGTGCPILAKAAASQRKSVEWERNARATTMDGAYRCTAFLDQPAVDRRGTAEDQTMTMFDVAVPDTMERL